MSFSFRAQSNDVMGRFIVSTEGIRFVRSILHKEMWNYSYSELKEPRKLRGSTVSKLTRSSIEQLEFEFKDGTVEQVRGIKDRDEAFNTVLGFSGLSWQVLQLGTTVQKQKGNQGKLKPTERA